MAWLLLLVASGKLRRRCKKCEQGKGATKARLLEREKKIERERTGDGGHTSEPSQQAHP